MRIGAIGDNQFVIDQFGIQDDLLILARHNLFEFTLDKFVNFAIKRKLNALAMYEEDNLVELRRSGVAEID